MNGSLYEWIWGRSIVFSNDCHIKAVVWERLSTSWFDGGSLLHNGSLNQSSVFVYLYICMLGLFFGVRSTNENMLGWRPNIFLWTCNICMYIIRKLQPPRLTKWWTVGYASALMTYYFVCLESHNSCMNSPDMHSLKWTSCSIWLLIPSYDLHFSAFLYCIITQKLSEWLRIFWWWMSIEFHDNCDLLCVLVIFKIINPGKTD